MNIAQIRDKYPQYKDLSDKQLADALHAKFYFDLPIQDYYKRIGFALEPAAVSKIKGLLPAPAADILHQFADVPIGFQKGVLQGIRMISDMFGANNAFSKVVKQNEEALANLMSAQAKNDQQEIARILKEAEDKGVLDQIKAGIKAFTVAPVDTLTSALGTAAPAIVAALGAKVLGAGALLTTGISMVTGAGMGAGTIKGTIYEETKKALQEAGVPEPIAEERAQKAQEYGGQNLDQILAGAAIGGVAARGPLEKGAVRALANRISKNVAAREAAESVSEKAAKSAATGRIRAGVAEALPEAGQAAQEQIAANIAQQREGLDVPTFRGAVAAGTMEGLAGAGLGAAFGGGRPPVEQPAPGTLPGETPIERAERLKAEAEAAKAAAQPPAPPVPTTAPAPGETTPPEEQAPAPVEPPAAEAAPPVEEPKVRKVGEPAPLPETLDDATIKTIGYFRGPTYNALIGKSITDPEVRTVLEEAKERTQSEKTAAKIDAFLARLPEPVAPPPPPAAEAAPVAPPPEIQTPAAPPTSPAAEAAPAPPPPTSPTPPAAAPVQPETPSVAEPQPEAGGAGVPVAGGPAAVSTAEGVGVEPSGVVPPVADAERPAGGEAAEPAAVTPTPAPEPPAPAPYVAPVSQGAAARAKRGIRKEAPVLDSEAQIDAALAAGLIDEETATRARTELAELEPPTTAMGQAFQKQIDDIKAQMKALRQKSGNKPAPNSKARKKFDALEAQLQMLVPKATGNLAERIELLELSSVIGKAPYPGAAREDSRVTLDVDLLKENLLKAKATPRMTEAILNYIGVDADGNYLPTVYSREEAAEMAGLSAATGSEVSRAAEAMGITLDVRSRFHAGQTELGVGAAKNVSEEGTGATDLNPRRGVLYAPKKKGPPAVAPFLRGALAPDGTLNFSEVPLESAKAKGDKPAVVGLAEMFVRASQFNRKNYQNDNVINALQAEVDRRIKLDRKKTNDAITRAYGKFTETEDVSSNQKALELRIEKGLRTGDLTPVGELEGLNATELAALVNEGEAKIDTKTGAISPVTKEKEVEETGPRLSDESYQQTRTGPVDLENSKQMDDALRGKSFTEAIDYAIRNARDDLDRQILVKVKRRAEELANNGVQFSFGLTAPGRVLLGKLGVAVTTPAGLGDATTVDIKLNGFTGDPNDTLSQETLAHELVHAVTVAQINYAPQSSAAIKLRALQQELVSIYNQRAKAGTLTATEKGVILNALENPKELLAYGLTNGETQNWLASITDPSGGTFLSRMFSIVSQVLGLKGKENSALARLMAVSEEILDESLAPYIAEANRQGLSFGKQANTTGIPSWVLKESRGLKPVWNKGPLALYEGTSTANMTIYIAAKQGVGRTHVDIRGYSGSGFTPAELAELRQAADNLTPQASPRLAPATEAAVEGVDVIGEQKEAKPISGNPAVKARIRIANNMAGLFDKFNEWYGGAIRTAGNRLIPTVFISRALDADRVSNEAQLIGGLRKVDELIVASEIRDANGNVVLGADGQPLSYANVLNRIATAAKKAGKSYDEYKKTVDKVLYGHREYYVRENNRLIEQQATALDAAGKTKEAAKLRENIAKLAIKDDKVLDNIEAQFQNDDFIKGVSADFDAIRFDFLDMLVETGRITKEVAQEWKDNVGYAPFNRVQDYEDTFDAESSRIQGVGVVRMRKKFEGSTRQSTSVIDNFSKLLDWATGEAMRNEAKNRALKDMVLMGAAKPRNGKVLASDEPGGVVKTFENGVAKEYLVPDPMLFVGFTMHTPEMNSAIRAFNRYGTRVLRAGVTMMPPFAIKQVFDDLTRAYTFAGVKNNAAMVKNILTNFPKNWFNEALGKEVWKTAKGQTSVKDLRRLGIIASYDLSREGNLKNIEVEAKARGESLWNMVLRVMEAGAKASDVSVRQGIYDQVLKETGDKVIAESAAREIINFSYQGSNKLVQGIASVVPFFNAYAQGTDKLAVAAAGKVVGMTPGMARSMFYTRMTTLTALGFAYALMMQDDDEYNKLDAHIRDTNWIIPGAKIAGMPVGIPVPADLAFFFKAIPERVVRYYKYSGTDEERAALDVLSELAVRGYDVFSPPNVTPQLIRPFFENLVNYSFFLGRPLESQAQLQRRPFERYGVGTSDAMKVVAERLEDAANATGIEAFAVSPIKLENLMRGLLGTAGGTALSVADWMVNPTRTDRPLHQQLSTQLSGASALLKNPVGNAYMSEIYSLEKKTEQVYNTYKNRLKIDPDKADKFLEDNIGMYEIRPAVQAIMEQIRALNKIAMQIDEDTSMSPEERRKEIDELRVEQNEIARVVFSLRKEARDIQMGK